MGSRDKDEDGVENRSKTDLRGATEMGERQAWRKGKEYGRTNSGGCGVLHFFSS